MRALAEYATTDLGPLQRMVESIEGNLETRGEGQGVDHRMTRSNTGRKGKMRRWSPQGSLVCSFHKSGESCDESIAHRLVPTSFMNIFTSDVFQVPLVPLPIESSVDPMICLEAKDTRSAYCVEIAEASFRILVSKSLLAG